MIYFIIVIFILIFIIIIYFINSNDSLIIKSNIYPSITYIPPIINNNPSINNKSNINIAINKLSLINNYNLKFNNEIIIALQEIKTVSSNSESLLNSFIKSLDNNNDDLSLNSKNKLLLFLKSLIPSNIPSNIQLNIPSNILKPFNNNYNFYDIILNYIINLEKDIENTILLQNLTNIVPSNILESFDIVPSNIESSINYTVKYFIYTGSIQTFDIPPNVNFINIYCWGAGGGNGYNFTTKKSGGYGGNGGFVSATLNVTSISSLSIIVGQGGKKPFINTTTNNSFGGGGCGGYGTNELGFGGGGGLSGIFVNNENMTINKHTINSNAIPILIAGGGGSAGTNNITLNGGNAGGLTGNNASGKSFGYGGTQTSGGFSGDSIYKPPNTNAGNKFMGGSTNDYGGGGGGGFYGGGAGGSRTNKTTNYAGGGGGSSYVNTTNFTLSNIIMPAPLSNGTRDVPGNKNKYYTSNVGLGANIGLNNGKNGLIVIEYISNDITLSEIPSKKLTPYPPLITPDYNNDPNSNNQNVIFINDVIDKNNNITTVESVYNIVVSSSYINDGGQGAFALIDNNKNSFWNSTYNLYFYPPTYNGPRFLTPPRNPSDKGNKGEWFYIKLPKKISLVQYSLGYAQGRGIPALWRIYGSNDGTNWIEIRQASPEIPVDANSFIDNIYTFNFKPPSHPYQYFGCVITILAAWGGDYAAQISDCRFYSLE